MSIQVMTTLAQAREASDYDSYKRLAKELGGVRKFGRDTPFSILQLIDSCGLWNGMWLMRSMTFTDTNAVRLLAADIAAVALPVYERYQHTPGAVGQAIKTARAFAKGEASKKELAHAHKLAEMAVKKTTIIGTGRDGGDHFAAKAAEVVSRPFCKPGEMLYQSWEFASIALDRTDSYLMVMNAYMRIMNRAKDWVEESRPYHTEEQRNAVLSYYSAIRDEIFDGVDEKNAAAKGSEQVFIDLLYKHIGEAS